MGNSQEEEGWVELTTDGTRPQPEMVIIKDDRLHSGQVAVAAFNPSISCPANEELLYLRLTNTETLDMDNHIFSIFFIDFKVVFIILSTLKE